MATSHAVSGMEEYSCRTCGTRHESGWLSWGPDAPDAYAALSDMERTSRGVLTADTCVIDAMQFFVRGRLALPIRDSSHAFTWLVWSSLSQESFERTVQAWVRPGREDEPPYFGWMDTELRAYTEPTRGLKLQVHTRPVGERPLIEVEPESHLLAREQTLGISWDRVQELWAWLHHNQSRPARSAI